MKMIILALGAAFLVGVGGFAYFSMKAKETADPKQPGNTPNPYPVNSSEEAFAALATGEWRLSAVGGVAVSGTPEIPYDLAFSERRIAGSFCNVFSASMNAGEELVLTFGPVQSTKKFCAGRPMEIESAFLALISGPVNFSLDSDHRTLLLEWDDHPQFLFTRREG